MLVNVDIVTAFDQSTGHRSRYVLSSADEPTTKQSITLQDGTSMASAIRLRLIEGGRAQDLQAAIKRSIEEPGAPQRLGSIEFDEDDRRCMTRSQELREPRSLQAAYFQGILRNADLFPPYDEGRRGEICARIQVSPETYGRWPWVVDEIGVTAGVAMPTNSVMEL